MSLKESVEFSCHLSVASESTAEFEPAGNLCYLKGGHIAFFPDKGANEGALRRLFGYNPPTSGAPKLLPKHLPGISDCLPLPSTFLHEKFSHIVGPEFSSKSTKNAFRAFVRYLNEFEKNGVRYRLTSDRHANPMRDGNRQRHMAQAEVDLFKQGKKGELVDALMRMYPMMSSHHDVQSEKLAGSGYHDFILRKSQGNQNMVFDLPDDFTKKVKINIRDNAVSSQLEALANRVAIGAGLEAPKTELKQHTNGTHYLLMDNYKVTRNCPIDRRQQYLLDLMGKPVSDVNANSYEEMAKFMETYELQLPAEIRSLDRMESNKQKVFQWALLNSATNNTDNHGRNLAVMFDDDGRIEVAPFIDVSFDPSQQAMSTQFGGPPPMERIDINNETSVRKLWEGCGIRSEFSQGLQMRDQVVQSLTNLPSYARELGIPLHSEAIDIAVKATAIHSPSVGASVDESVELGRQQIERERSRAHQSSAEMGI